MPPSYEYEPLYTRQSQEIPLDPESEEYLEMEKTILSKQDWNIMPLLCVSYLLNYLDRTNLANAKTLNADRPGESIIEVLNLTGDRFNFVVAIFFLPYVLFELPSNLMLTIATPSRWIARIMISWAVVTIATAGVSSYPGLVVSRIALGICEAGYFPGVLLYLCYFYKPSERALRMSIFSASVSVAGAFGGLIATAVSCLSGVCGLYGWQWLYLLEGLPALVCGFVILFRLPDYPETARFLTSVEREFAAYRMGPLSPKMDDHQFRKIDIVNALTSWQFWAFAIAYFCITLSGNAFGYFAPTIISGLGFQGALGQLLTVPPNIFALFVVIFNSYHSDRSRERPLHIIAGCCIIMCGWLILSASNDWIMRYIGVCLIASTNAAIIPLVAYCSSCISGSSATAVFTGGIVAVANLSGAVAPFLFPSSSAPNYQMGATVCVVLDAVAIVLVRLLWISFGASAKYRNTGTVVIELGDEDAESDPEDGKKGVVATSAEAVDE